MMRYAATVMKVVVTMLMMLAAGCGGGGGGTDNNSGTLAISVTSPTISTPTGTISATYTDPLGRNPQGLEISFSTDRPDIVALDDTRESVGSNGQAMVTFRTTAPAIDTTVKLIATTGDLRAFQQITVTGSGVITPPPVGATPNSIAFISASPDVITLKGMGGAGRSEASIITFEVRDSAGQPLVGQTVDFSLNTSIGGLTITPATAVSNSSGRVQTIVNSGTIATPIRVTATVRGSSPAISTQSDQLVVSTGIPDQDSLSISISNFNVEGLEFDGETTTVTARLADHFNNPVPDGTAIYFTTEGGSIQPSCTTVNGACSVLWTSQAPRPVNGLVTILAYAVGEESFIDLNGNGLADVGEFTDLAEAFRDDNLDGVRQLSETFIDFDADSNYDSPDGIYNGVLRSPSVTGPQTLHIFENSGIIMSGSTAVITFSASPINVPASGTNVTIRVRDVNNNIMPAGTTIVVTTTNGQLVGSASGTVTNAYAPNSFSELVVTLNQDNTPGTTGVLTVKVTTPNGVITQSTAIVND